MAQATPSLSVLKRQRMRRLAKLISRAYFLQQRGKVDEMYTMIFNEFVAMGGVYVKFLQGVLLNNSIMKRWHSADRMKIFENLDTVDLDIISFLQSELKPEQLKAIALVQPKPFAAGSFGQVYYGQHLNGNAIIIKILRPQVRELLRYDLRLLTMFTRAFVNREYKSVSMNLSAAIREFRHATLRETDYVTEAHFAAELHEAYKNDPKIVIPKTYLELSNDHIIVQDYLAGLSLVDVLKVKQDGKDPVAYVKEQIGSDLDEQLISFGSALVSGALTLSRIQGDPHPGNIRLLPDNKVGTIDFGISAASPKNHAAFFQVLVQLHSMYGQDTEDIDIVALFEAFMRFFVNDLYNALKKLSGRSGFTNKSDGTQVKSSAKSDLVAEVGTIVKGLVGGIVGNQDIKEIIRQGKTLDLFNNVVNNNNRLGLMIQLESSEVIRAMQTYLALIGALGRRDTVFTAVFARAISDIEKDIPNIRYQTDDMMTTSRAFETVNIWLERVASRDPDLFRELLATISLNSSEKVAEKVKPIKPTKKENHA